MSYSTQGRARRNRGPLRCQRNQRKLNFEPLENRLLLSIFYVTNTDDSGTGSLRQAIESVDLDPLSNGQDIIEPSQAALGTISPQSAFPALTRGDVTIEDLNLDGSGAGSGADGLDIQGGDDALLGMQITGFGATGVSVTSAANTIGGTASGAGNLVSDNNYGVAIAGASATGNLVEGNLIGTDASGTSAAPNTDYGVVVFGGATGNTIGGTVAGSGNVLSGNGIAGVFLTQAGTTGNVVMGNDIGTNLNGTTALANATYGVVINGGASGNLIGGSTAAARNIISGNTTYGIAIFSSGTSANLVEGNYIGTNASGNGAIANGQVGVIINGSASNNTIGGTASGAGNLISGNGQSGIVVSSSTNLIAGNDIGTDVSGTIALGNTDNGVVIDSGATDNTLGGTATGAGNVISANGNSGVVITDSGTSGNVVEGNKIGTDVSGTIALGNAYDGVAVVSGAADDTIGGTAAGAGNLIAANASYGVWITGSGVSGIAVEGNKIGTDVSGADALGNKGDGVHVDSGASYITIGGTVQGAGNVISANSGGINENGSDTEDNLIAGNLIGTNASGTSALPNVGWGVFLGDTGPNITVGGSTSGAGNVISGNKQGGVAIYGIDAVGDVVQGNMIGTDISGTQRLGNGYSGVYVGDWGNTGDEASNVTIGGTTAGAGNVISANGNWGVWISGASVTGVVVQGNKIGTDVTGSHALGNSYDGVEIDSGAVGNTIGGTSQGAGNVISGNGGGVDIIGPGTNDVVLEGNQIGTNAAGTQGVSNGAWGVYVQDSADDLVLDNLISGNHQGGLAFRGIDSQNELVQGNDIGTDITGTLPLGNEYSGIYVGDWGVSGDPASNVTIGGTAAGAGNVISDNGEWGVWISGAGVSGVVVEGNMIGTDASGTVALGNAYSGVQIDSGAVGNTIGGTAAGAGNVISGNDEHGVVVTGNGTSQNVIAGDRIGTNANGTAPIANKDGGVLVSEFGSLTLDSNVAVSGGVTVAESGSATVTGPSNTITGSLFLESGALTVSGANASLTVNGPASLAGGNVTVSSDGMLSLPEQTSISSNYGVNILATGSNSVIDLSALTSWTTTYSDYGYESSLSVTDGATVEDGGLTTLNGVKVTLDGTGKLAVSQWTSFTDGSLEITGGDYAPTSNAATSSNSFANLSDIDGSGLYVSGGGSLSLPDVTSYTGNNDYYYYQNGQYYYSAFPFQVTDTTSGGLLSLPNLTTIGGYYGVSIEVAGSQSQIDLPDLTSFSPTDIDYAELSVTQSGTVEDPLLTTLNDVEVTLDGTGTIAVSQWQSLTDDSLEITGGDYLADRGGRDFRQRVHEPLRHRRVGPVRLGRREPEPARCHRLSPNR